MKDRIIEFLKAENKTSAQLAEEIGVQPSGISHILSGRNNPSLDFVMKMLEKYKYLSTEWLLFGKGNMYREQGMQKLFDDGLLKTGESAEIEITGTPEPGRNVGSTQSKAGAAVKNEPVVEKIVWFYSDKSFKEYFPGNGDN
jgi:transcriptional regulator with XRE-family HTH domain